MNAKDAMIHDMNLRYVTPYRKCPRCGDHYVQRVQAVLAPSGRFYRGHEAAEPIVRWLRQLEVWACSSCNRMKRKD